VSRIPGTYARPAARIWPGRIPGTHEPGFVEETIVERPDLGPAIVHGERTYELHAFTMGACRMLLGHEPDDDGELRWHMTISCSDRHPTWDEIKTARYRLLGPDLKTAMFLPPVDEYVNVPSQDHVFHVWEVGR
jgi:hypothetical protein